MLVLTEDKETGTFQVGTTGKRICTSVEGWAGDTRMRITAWLLGTRAQGCGAGKRRRWYLFIGRPTGKRQGATGGFVLVVAGRAPVCLFPLAALCGVHP